MAKINFNATEQEQLNRMKALINYGRVDENKKSYSGIENTKVGADSKTYGIIREGAKYFIKVTDKKKPLVEDFEYIGGFRNRKNHEYDSFANAQKNLDMMIKSINENLKTPSDYIQSWENKGENNQIVTESTKKMQEEIARQRQIMMNVSRIDENKTQILKPINEDKSCGENDPFCQNPDKEFKDAQKDNMKGKEPSTGDAKKANKEYKDASIKGTDIKESEEVLGFNRDNDDYLDKAHGTEIGDSAPFDDNVDGSNQEVVEEGESMHDTDNQNSPAPGVGEVGDNQPFDDEKGRDIDEAIEDMGDTLEEDEFDDIDGDDVELGDMDDLVDDGDEEGVEDALADDAEETADLVDDVEDGEEAIADEEDTVEGRLSALEDMITKITNKLGVGTYEDEELFDDNAEEGADDVAAEDAPEDEIVPDEPVEDEGEDLEDCVTYESKAYRALKLREAAKRARKTVNEENRLDDFGKHPAYQKKVMSLPPKDQAEKEGYYDMNDDSAKNDKPFGLEIGDSAPFEIDPEAIKNAIAESIQKVLKKKH